MFHLPRIPPALSLGSFHGSRNPISCRYVQSQRVITKQRATSQQPMNPPLAATLQFVARLAPYNSRPSSISLRSRTIRPASSFLPKNA